MHSVSILTIGSEVLDGRVQDSNSNYLCKKLAALGLNVSQILSCTDVISDINDLLTFASKRSNILILTGGLGPTTDDLTREAVAEFYSVPLKLNEGALSEMKALYQRRGRNFNPTNEKQALFPEGSLIVPNPVGTAPGFMIEDNTSDSIRVLVSLPGVPRELYAMFESTIEPFLKNLKGITPVNIKGFKCFGIPEAQIGARIQELNIPAEIFVSYRAAFPEVHIALKSHSTGLQHYYEKTMEAVGKDFIFTTDLAEDYEALIHKLLIEKNLSLSTAESCTGGMLSGMLTNVPGASQSYLGSIISYANSVKEGLLKVDKDQIVKFGAVSSEVAKVMAENCRKEIKSDISLSISGIAGPDGGTKEKPVGLFYIGIASKDHVSAHKFFLPLQRSQIRQYACSAALDVLRRYLTEVPQIPDAKLPENP
jgi:nicotinamide-nucleotide amidase